jgi:hypothetical protein
MPLSLRISSVPAEAHDDTSNYAQTRQALVLNYAHPEPAGKVAL